MTAEVVRLIPNNALAVDHEQLADRLRALADELEAGDLGRVDRAVIVLDGEQIDYRAYGRQTNLAELVGILEWCKLKVIL